MKKSLFIPFLLLLCIIMCCCSPSETDIESSREAAICKCLQSEKNIDISVSELNQYILSSIEYNNDMYYLVMDNTEIDKKPIDYVFILNVIPVDDCFTAEKATADFYLDSPQPVNDADYTPYNEFSFNIDERLGMTVGKMFDTSLQPFYNNKPLLVNAEGIFFVWTDPENPKGDIVYN